MESDILNYLSRAVSCLEACNSAFSVQDDSLTADDIEKLSAQIKISAVAADDAAIYRRTAASLIADMEKQGIKCSRDDFFLRVKAVDDEIGRLADNYLETSCLFKERIKEKMGKYSAKISGISSNISKITAAGGDDRGYGRRSFINSPEMIDISI